MSDNPEAEVKQEAEKTEQADTGGAAGAERPEFGEDPTADETFWEKVRKGVVDGVHYAADKTDLYAKISGRRLNIVSLNRRIDRTFNEPGEKVYNLLVADSSTAITEDAAVKELVGKIREAEEELTRKEAEIEEIRHEYRERTDAKKTGE